jgi:hypothetical protein
VAGSARNVGRAWLEVDGPEASEETVGEMAIIQVLLAALARSAGRILNTAVGWATTMIFGRVPEKRQIYVSIMTFGSLVWIAVIVGIAFPSVGTFLLSFVPLPSWVDRKWVRLAMTVAATVLPALVGTVSLLLRDPDERPAGSARLRAVLRGYPFTLGLAVTLLMMCVLAPVMKLQTLMRRWASQHIPVVVRSEDYDDVLEQVQRVLATGGWRTERRVASWMVRLPTRVLTLLAGRALDAYVAQQLTTLRAERFEAVLHPSDLVLSGEEAQVVHARSLLAEQLAFGKAHLTWTRDAQALEDDMRSLHGRLALGAGASGSRHVAGLGPALDHVDSRLKDLDVTYEEWEVLFRQRLLLRLVAEAKKRGGSGDGVSVSEAHGERRPAWRAPGVEGAAGVGSSEAR